MAAGLPLALRAVHEAVAVHGFGAGAGCQRLAVRSPTTACARHVRSGAAAHRDLLPSLTETVCELGQCHRLVGVDRYSNHPAPVRSLPQVGGGVDPNVEAVVALKPDLVLAAISSRGIERLESLGSKVLALEPAPRRMCSAYWASSASCWRWPTRSASGATSTPASRRRPSHAARARAQRVLRGQPRPLCGGARSRSSVRYWRDSARATSSRQTWGLSRRSTQSTWCGPTRT